MSARGRTASPSWSGKPAAIVTVSPGAIGGFGANHHLRQSLVYLDMPTLPQPEAYIGNAGALFDDSGAITNDDRRKLLQKFVAAFASVDREALRYGRNTASRSASIHRAAAPSR